ncbi:hypothetical protein [Variovorax sp. W2I14]|uniref:hypothetical protein n=1 Tax=Variovorax sp. W2I14 TaxID=3042290 RepID=UPI003D1FC0CC
MGIFILPDAQEDLLSLQECTLDTWSESDWLKAEDEIFEKLTLVDTGFLTGAHVQELASVGILNVFTSHHKLGIGVSAMTRTSMPQQAIGKTIQRS